MNNEKQWLQKIAGIKTSLNESFFGGYVDLSPVNRLSEEMDTEEEPEGDQYDGEYDAESGPAITSELEKPEKIYATDDSEDEKGFDVPGDDTVIDTNRMMELGGDQIEQNIMFLLDDGFDPEDVLDMCRMFIEGHSDSAGKDQKFEGEDNLKPSGELEW